MLSSLRALISDKCIEHLTTLVVASAGVNVAAGSLPAAAIGVGSVFAARQLSRAFKEKPQAEQAFQDAARRIRQLVGNDVDHATREDRDNAKEAVKQFEALICDLPLSLHDIHDYLEAARRPGVTISVHLADRLLKRITPGTLLEDEPYSSFARGVLEDAFGAAIEQSPAFTSMLTLELVRDLIANLGETPADLNKRFNDLAHELECQTRAILAAVDVLGGRLERRIDGGFQAILAEIRHRLPDAAAANAAVTEITRIVEANTPADAPARAALAAGDVEGAYSALMDEVQTDRLKAAERARAAGALQFDRNVRKAIDAYEEAEVLSPGDFWTLIFLSRLYMRAGLVHNAYASARKAVLTASTARERLVALNDLGDAAGRLSDQRAILVPRSAHYESLSIAKKIAAENPMNWQSLRDLWVSSNKAGDVELKFGYTQLAIEQFNIALDASRIVQQLLPDDIDVKREYALSFERSSDACLQQDRMALALKEARQSLQLRHGVLLSSPTNNVFKRDLSVSYLRVGDLAARRLCGTKIALRCYKLGVELRDQLWKNDQSDEQACRDLAVALNRYGCMLQESGEIIEAKRIFVRSASLSKSTVDRLPSDKRAQRDLSVALLNIARVSGGVEAQAALAQLKFCASNGFLDPGDDALLVEARQLLSPGEA